MCAGPGVADSSAGLRRPDRGRLAVDVRRAAEGAAGPARRGAPAAAKLARTESDTAQRRDIEAIAALAARLRQRSRQRDRERHPRARHEPFRRDRRRRGGHPTSRSNAALPLRATSALAVVGIRRGGRGGRPSPRTRCCSRRADRGGRPGAHRSRPRTSPRCWRRCAARPRRRPPRAACARRLRPAGAPSATISRCSSRRSASGSSRPQGEPRRPNLRHRDNDASLTCAETPPRCCLTEEDECAGPVGPPAWSPAWSQRWRYRRRHSPTADVAERRRRQVPGRRGDQLGLGDGRRHPRDVHAGRLRLPGDRLLARQERGHDRREDPRELRHRRPVFYAVGFAFSFGDGGSLIGTHGFFLPATTRARTSRSPGPGRSPAAT